MGTDKLFEGLSKVRTARKQEEAYFRADGWSPRGGYTFGKNG